MAKKNGKQKKKIHIVRAKKKGKQEAERRHQKRFNKE